MDTASISVGALEKVGTKTTHTPQYSKLLRQRDTYDLQNEFVCLSQSNSIGLSSQADIRTAFYYGYHYVVI